MEKKIGFIGCGIIREKAILGGLIASGQVLPRQICIHLLIKSPPPGMTSSASTPQNRRKKWRKSPTSFLLPLNLAS